MRKRHAERYRRRHRRARATKHRKFNGHRVARKRHHHLPESRRVSAGAAILAGFGLGLTLGIGAFFMMPFILGGVSAVGVMVSLTIFACLSPFVWLSASTLIRAVSA